jgi:predicted amidohydrolase YtcJ
MNAPTRAEDFRFWHWVVGSSLWALASGLSVTACQPRGTSADLVVYGTIWTGDSAHPEVRALAVRGDTIIATGDSVTIAALAGPATRVLAAGGGLVVPGFADGHTHFSDGGAQLGYVDLRDAATPAEFVRRIKVYAAKLKPGEWILGGTWDHEAWPGAPLPRKDWIDSVTPDNPVFVQRLDGHMGLANSRALALAHVARATANMPGGTIVRDTTGEPTGILKDNAMGPVMAVIPPPTPAQADSALAAAMRFANSQGVVAVSAVSSPWSEVAAFKRAHARGSQTVRVSLYPAIEDWRHVADTFRVHGAGDEWLRLAGVKAFVDGSLGSTTALFFDHYLDDPTSAGLFVTPEDSLRRWISAADSAGLQVAVHAIGDRANALILDIFDAVTKAHGARDRRFRIEHAQHLRQQDIPRFGASGVIASMQPYHAADDGRWAWKRIRPAQIAGTYAFRSLLDSHAYLQFGSDWTVAPINPLVGIWAAVTRQTLDGKNPSGWIPEQKITVEEALRAYTAGNAYGVFAEKRRGTLAPGMCADIVILDQDIRAIPPDSIRNTRVRTTVVAGKVVFGN